MLNTRPAAPPPIPRLTPGTVLGLHERDYRYGIGYLGLRVSEVGVDRIQAGAEWVPVRGHRMSHDGRVDTRELEILVAVTALREGAIKPTGWLPPVTAVAPPRR
ncbi:hypothetical protein [Catenuloplanes japonicus]|uniref:hypothetical protein n=1 Tax=Catenuloplanes japonicus TaxID=33876 RepID=UPI0005268268|nr:hypothetical protein [Catenuloplanes japonicus]